MWDTAHCSFFRSRVIRVRARLGERGIVSGLGSISTGSEEWRDLLLGRSNGSSMLALARQGSATRDDRQGFGLDRSHGVAVAVVEAVPRVPESSCASKRDRQWRRQWSTGPAVALAVPAVDKQRALTVTCLQQDNRLRRGSVRANQFGEDC